jgi:uncharacterized coiled-coil DUF342 family protein
VLLLVCLLVATTGCESAKPSRQTEDLLQAVGEARRMISQAQSLKSLPLIYHDPSGEVSPFSASLSEKVFAPVAKLQEAAADRRDGGSSEANAEASRAYNEALTSLEIRVDSYGDIHPSLLDQDPETNVLLEAQQKLENALQSNPEADEESRMVAKMMLASVQAVRARALLAHGAALRQMATSQGRSLDDQLQWMNRELNRAQNHNIRAEALSANKPGGLVEMKQTLEDLQKRKDAKAQEVKDLTDLRKKAMEKMQQRTSTYDQLHLDYQQKLSKAKESNGQEALDLLKEAVAISQKVTQAATDARQAKAEADKAKVDLVIASAALDKVRDEMQDVQKAIQERNKAIAGRQQRHDELLAGIGSEDGPASEASKLLDRLAANVEEIYDLEVKAENILTSLRSKYGNEFSSSRDPQAIALLGELALAQADLLAKQVRLGTWLKTIEADVRSQWARLGKPAPQGLDKLASYLGDPVKARSRAAELAGEAGDHFAKAASFVDPRGEGKWLYQQNAAIAYAAQYRLVGDAEAQSKAREALDEAMQGLEDHPQVAENNRQIRQLLGS